MITANTQSVNVERLVLLEKLKENRSKHVSEYNEAVGAYKQTVIDTLKKVIKDVQADKVKELNVCLPKPMSYESQYTEVIEMLEMSVDDVINLDRSAFKQYVQDIWSWSEGFKSITSSYIGAN